MHLYLYSIERGFLNAITSGEWEVTELLGVEGDIVNYESTEPSPLMRADYIVRLDGEGKRMTSPPSGSWATGAREFFTFTNDTGISLNGWMMKPDGFKPGSRKKYPVFMTQYSGPGSQSVSYEALSAGDLAIYEPLLKAGYIVVCVDGRGTGGRGEEFKKCTYGALGKLETEDQIAVARWLATLPYTDPARMGIYGWSYGGFVALNAILKGADVFALAVAVAPVTSWRYYDTIYTEAYNGLPQNNPEGYDDNSPVNYAGLLRGKLLLVHGTGDDNVHVQNSYEMARALVVAGKQFDMMTYTDANHSMSPGGGRHVRAKIVDYVITNCSRTRFIPKFQLLKPKVFLFLLWPLAVWGCRTDCGDTAEYDLTSVDADMIMANEEGVAPVASDLRLNLIIGIRRTAQQLPVSIPFIQTAYACSPAPSFLNDPVMKLELTCDKDIRGFASGQNILTSSAAVGPVNLDTDNPFTTLGEWLPNVSYGYSLSDQNVFIAFIPKGTVVPAGDYTFTLALELISGKRYVIPFEPVTL
jgi:dienelactone hydrolase